MYTGELLGTEGLKMCFCLFQPIFNSVTGTRSIQIRAIVIQEILGKVNKPIKSEIRGSRNPVHQYIISVEFSNQRAE